MDHHEFQWPGSLELSIWTEPENADERGVFRFRNPDQHGIRPAGVGDGQIDLGSSGAGNIQGCCSTSSLSRKPSRFWSSFLN